MFPLNIAFDYRKNVSGTKSRLTENIKSILQLLFNFQY